jgi:hypothetical protein
MGYFKQAPPKTTVEVLQSTHGQTFVTWPTSMAASGSDLPALPVGHQHARSRHWVLANKTVVLILPGDPAVHMGGVIRHTFDIVSASWNNRAKTLTSLVVHPSDPDVTFSISTSGVGCACTQGPAGNAGPIGEPYKISMVRSSDPAYDWFEVVTP